MAFEELEPPDQAAAALAARVAYYAAHGGNFGNGVTLQSLLHEFGVIDAPAPAQTLGGLAGMLEALGGEMPDHVRERFQER